MVRAIVFLMVILMASPSAQAADKTAYDFSFTAIDGGPLPLADFKGKAVLVVNTASECGYTPQYKDMQALWQLYRDRGLVVLGVPSNDFGGQEPGTRRRSSASASGNMPSTSRSRPRSTSPAAQRIRSTDGPPMWRVKAPVRAGTSTNT